MTSEYLYDIAISFAGEDRDIAKSIAENLRNEGVEVFYDEFKEDELWGRNGYEYFVDVFAHKSKYCLMLISKHYERKVWTTHERRAAQSRAMKDKEPYILPLRLDDTELPGEIHTVFYQDLRQKSIDQVTELLLKVLKKKIGSQANSSLQEKSSIEEAYNVKMPNIKRSYTDLEKEDFLYKGYKYISGYLKEGLQMLENNEPSVSIKFTNQDDQVCVGYIYKEGKLIQGFKLWIGGLFNKQSICLRLGKHNIENSENSFNEVISINERENELILNVTMGSLNYGNSSGLNSKEKIAEYIWTGITRPLEY